MQQQANQPETVLNRWRQPRDRVRVQRYATGLLRASNATASDAGFSDASFIRLKNVSISYQLADRIVQKVHLQRCRIFLHGQNLFTLTKYKG